MTDKDKNFLLAAITLWQRMAKNCKLHPVYMPKVAPYFKTMPPLTDEEIKKLKHEIMMTFSETP